MRVLVLGGTGWLGRAIVAELLTRGAEVTCLARGVSGAVPAGAQLIRSDRRSGDAYEQVRGAWDEVIELSSERGLVEPALTALAGGAAHWTLVSSVSVYARNDEPGADESAAVVEPTDPARYADAKVHAERVTSDRLAKRLTVVRPGLIVGAGDPSDRFGYWPARLSRGGRVITPTTRGRFVQVIDVVDLAAWIARAARTRHSGVVNAVGEPMPMRDFFDGVASTVGSDAEMVAVDDATLLAHDVRYWAGPRSLPLWLPSTDTAFAQRGGAAFQKSGGRTRPFALTVKDVADDERARGVSRPRRSGLTRSEEEALLVRVR
ncbi:NAD-dependent epimerase/dehydratase family protein [Herbiconiux sp. A18JL235]|uniref:NAD-dependent epimerase/dehydratase family protein n=1 Tax=Herbiconiux sp. A18JL235 TaxID=3152363 RepID=A0AB39BCM3_9MICO